MQKLPGVLTFDPASYRLTYANPRACRLFGLSLDEGKTHTVFSLLKIGPQGGDDAHRLETVVTTSHGGELPVELLLETLELPGGRQLVVVLRDRSDQKQVESASRILRAALDAAEDVIALIDPESLRFIEVNVGAVKSLGYSKEELLKLSPIHLKPGITREQYRERYVRPLLDEERDSIRFEAVHRRKDGTEYPVEVLLQRIDDGVKPGVLLNIARNISELKRSQVEQDRFFAVSWEMLCISNLSGYFSRVNPSFTRVLGWTQEELLDRPFIEFVHPEDVEATNRAVDDLLTGERLLGFENRYRCRNGGYRILSWTAMHDPETSRLYAAARDVTEERETERELEEARALDRAGRRTLTIFNQRKDVDGTLREALAVLAEELKFTRLAFYVLDEGKGQLKLSAALSSPADRPRLLKLGEGMVGQAAECHTFLSKETGTHTHFAIPLIHQERTLAVLTGDSARPLSQGEQAALEQLASQTAVGLYALNQFRQLRKLSEQLTERGRQIASQNEELKRANRLKSEFLANMSHELRTPLNAIIGFSECLKDGLLGELEEEQADYATEIFSSGQHLLSLINDILDLSKIEAGMMEIRMEETDVRGILTNSLSIIRDRAVKNSVLLEKEIDPALEPIAVDARKFRQIVYNLLSNAVKFTDRGGKVTLRAVREGESLLLQVEDTGIGIAPENLERLFEPFVQLDGNLDRRYEGTGLGLALVKKLVELHGGTVEVWSELARGSRFSVKIPYRCAPKEPASEPWDGAPPGKGTEWGGIRSTGGAGG